MISRTAAMAVALVLHGCSGSGGSAATQHRAGSNKPSAPAPDKPIVTVLDPGREPRAHLTLSPRVKAADEVELAMRGWLGGPGASDNSTEGEIRVLVNARADRNEANGFAGEILIGTDNPGLPPCPPDPPSAAGESDPVEIIGPVGMAQALAEPRCAPAPLTGTFRVSADGIAQPIDLAFPSGGQLLEGASSALALVWPVPLPAQPVGAGARWRVEEIETEGGFEARTVTDYELTAFDGKTGSLRVRAESSSTGTATVDPALGDAKARDFKLHMERQIELDLARLVWASTSSLQIAMTIEIDGQQQRLDQKMEVAVRFPASGPLVGLLPATAPRSVAAAALPLPRCRTLRGPITGAIENEPWARGARVTGACRDGLPEGRWLWQDASGKRQGEGQFSGGTGNVTAFAPDGTRRGEAGLRGGVAHGAYWSAHAGGSRAIEGRFRDGQPEGMWTLRDERGQLVRREDREPRCNLVVEAIASEAAAAAGIAAGDRIDRIGATEIQSYPQLKSVMAGAAPGKVSLRVIRDGKARTLSLTPGVGDDGKPRLGVRLACCRVEHPAGETCAP